MATFVNLQIKSYCWIDLYKYCYTEYHLRILRHLRCRLSSDLGSLLWRTPGFVISLLPSNLWANSKWFGRNVYYYFSTRYTVPVPGNTDSRPLSRMLRKQPDPLAVSDTVDPWGKASIVVTDVHMVCWVPGVRHPSSSQTYTWSVGWRPPTGAVADVTICCCCDHYICNPIHI